MSDEKKEILMSDILAVSNEYIVEIDNEGYYTVYKNGEPATHHFPPEVIAALKEYLQHTRDTLELGRWRDPENPDIVVYPNREGDDEYGRCIWVFDERTCEYSFVWEGYTTSETALRYFKENPRPEPEPWEYARKGDYWILTIDGVDSLWHHNGLGLSHVSGGYLTSKDPMSATDGRLVWPVLPEVGPND